METGNLFRNVPISLPEELSETLATSRHVRIERIISTGQSTPEGAWYDQPQTEWVLILTGEAKLLFEGDEEPIHMQPGDFVNIPAHRKHRVEWTTADAPTLWLTVFYSDE